MSTAKEVLVFKQKASALQAQLDDFADYVDMWRDVDQLKMRMKSADKTWEAYSNLFTESANSDSSNDIRQSLIWTEFKTESDRYFETMCKAQRIIDRRTSINSWFKSGVYKVYCIIKYFVYFIVGILFLTAVLEEIAKSLERRNKQLLKRS